MNRKLHTIAMAMPVLVVVAIFIWALADSVGVLPENPWVGVARDLDTH